MVDLSFPSLPIPHVCVYAGSCGIRATNKLIDYQPVKENILKTTTGKMKIILVVLGLLLPRRSSGTFLRHVVEGGGGRMLQSCEQDCQYNKCAVEGKAECLKEAEKTADQKHVWCVEQNGNYKKWQDTACGATLKEDGEQEIDCSMFSSCQTQL